MRLKGLTVFSVVEYLEVSLDARGQRLFYHGHGVLRRHRSLEKIADRRTLHDLGSAVTCHVAETVGAVDYVTAGLLRIGYQKTTV